MTAHDVSIKAHNLSKCYLIYEKPSDRLKQFIIPRLCRTVGICAAPFSSVRRPLPSYYREFWALKDVSLDIKKGEIVGIIGRNGSGKSTLLQLICGTLSSSGGLVQTRGRIAALLELGSGFNPDFTGLENIYMNAAVLGLSKDEIDARCEDIIEFSEIGEFIRQPLKTYSSGMGIRLAFAIAINVAPDIVVIDEALAVGDERFQRKCFARIEAIRASGATILFVSHSGSQIVDICDRAVLLDGGELLAVGKPKQVVGSYQKLLYAPADRQGRVREEIRLHSTNAANLNDGISVPSVHPHAACRESSGLQEGFDSGMTPSSTIEYESHGASIEGPVVQNATGAPVNTLICGKKYRYSYVARFSEGAGNVRFGMMIKTVSGVELGGGTSAMELKDSLAYVGPGSAYRVEFSFHCVLNPGTYFLSAGIMGDLNGGHGYLCRLVDVAMFRVLPGQSGYATGVVDFSCTPHIEVEEVDRNG